MNPVFRKSLVMTSPPRGLAAHSYRYAMMTHVPFSTQWCNVLGLHTESLCGIEQNEMHDELGISFSWLLCYFKVH